MRREERAQTRAKLDSDQRDYQKAAQSEVIRGPWLREIRLALQVPARELAGKLGINRTEIFRAEEREAEKRISLAALERMAEALDCRLVYAVVPKKGTLEDLWLKRAWESLFGEDGEKKFKEMLKREMKERDRPEQPPKQEKKKRESKSKRRILRQDRPESKQGDPEPGRYYYS
jgi:transcriptional regulator with XRE-family HTH domain